MEPLSDVDAYRTTSQLVTEMIKNKLFCLIIGYNRNSFKMPNDEPIDDDEKQFCIERAKTGRAACKKCKEKCETKELRIAKLAPSPFG